jgi:pimeloyl-ACP methyl ester carboxylesterase
MLTFRPISHEDAELMVSDAVRGSAAARRAWVRQTGDEDITDAVGHIDVPTVVISGEHDKIDLPETLRHELLPRIPGAVLVDTIVQAPQSAAMTWMCETANAHVPGCPCPSVASQMKASPFKE